MNFNKTLHSDLSSLLPTLKALIVTVIQDGGEEGNSITSLSNDLSWS